MLVILAVISLISLTAIPFEKSVEKELKAKALKPAISEAYNAMLKAGKVPEEVQNGPMIGIVQFTVQNSPKKIDIGDVEPSTIANHLAHKESPELR